MVRFWVPVWRALLHERVHVDQAVQTWMQSTSHGAVLQLRVFSRTVGHATPPASALTVMERVRDCTPPSQDSEQVLQAVQAVWTQSIAHMCVLHVLTSLRCWHDLPPKVGTATTTRVRFITPVPQLLVQVDQAANGVCSQSVGQLWGLHDLVSAE